MIVCTILSTLVIKINLIKVQIPVMSKRQSNNAFVLAVIWSLSVALSSSSLSLIDVGLFTVVKCAVPAWSALLSYLILNKRVDTNILIALVFLVFGPILSSYADINLTLLGAIITNSVNLFTSLKITLSTKIFSESDAWEPIFLLNVMSPRAAIFLLPLTVSEIYYHSQTVPISQLLNAKILLGLGFGGVLAFLLNASNFVTYKEMNSPLLYSVIGNVKKVGMYCVSLMVDPVPVTSVNILGIFLTGIGVAYYSLIEYFKKQKAQSAKKFNI